MKQDIKVWKVRLNTHFDHTFCHDLSLFINKYDLGM